MSLSTNHQKKFAEVLKFEFQSRKTSNPSYSLRSFATFLGVSPSILSEFFSEKRTLSKRNFQKVCEKLKISPRDVVRDKRSANATEAIKKLEPLEFNLISEWYYFAILNLAAINDSKADARWISRRLGVPVGVIETAVSRLVRLRLLRVDDGKLVRLKVDLRTTTDVPSEEIRKFHKQNLEMASRSLDDVGVAARDVTAVILPVELSRMPKMKSRIQCFKDDFSAEFKNGAPDEVYALCIQLFPLTQVKKGSHESS